MLMTCWSPVFGGIVGSALMACVVGVVLLVNHRLDEPHDGERELRRLTQQLRHPWRARVARWLSTL